LQYLLVPVLDSPPELVHALTPTHRGSGGGGSTGT
jgi:dUTPase